MKLENHRKILQVILAVVLSFAVMACGENSEQKALTQAYTNLYNAVKSKDTEKIKSTMSKATIAFAEGVSAQQKKPVAEIFANGFTATTFAESLPETRDARVKDNYGNIEVYNQKDNRWEDLPFIKEDGTWKLAVGDVFAGSFKSPGKSQAQIQAQNSNSANIVPYPKNINGNFSGGNSPADSSNAAPPANVNTVQVKPEKSPAGGEKKK